MATCCYPQGLLSNTFNLDAYVTDSVHQDCMGLSTLQEYCNVNGISTSDIVEVRFKLSRALPFKLGYCNAGFRCCGQCTKRCTKRCVQDVLHRYWLMLKGPENNVYTIAAKNLQKQREVTYEQLRLLVEDQLCVKTHKNLKKFADSVRTESYSHFVDNPYRYNYEPQKVVDATGVVVNADTKEVELYSWPMTGLCPYCLPSRMIIRRRSYKDRQV